MKTPLIYVAALMTAAIPLSHADEESIPWFTNSAFTGIVTPTSDGFVINETNMSVAAYRYLLEDGLSFSFAGIGDTLTITGSITLGGSLRVPSAHQNSVRVGVLNHNGSTTDQGWFGYFGGVDVNNGATTHGGIDRRAGAATDFTSRSNINQLSAYESDVAALKNVTYDFSFVLTRELSGLRISSTIFEADNPANILLNASAIDVAPNTYDFTRLVIQTNGNGLGADQFTLSHLSIIPSQIPEPGMLFPVLGLAAFALHKVVRRKKYGASSSQ